MHNGRALAAFAALALTMLTASCADVTGSFGRLPNHQVEIYGHWGRYHVRFYDTDGLGCLTDQITVEATVKGDEIVFTVPDGQDGAGEYRGHVTERGFAGTWTHNDGKGATVTESILWGRWTVVATAGS